LALLLGAYPDSQRSHVVALWGGIGALAVATGPSLGALLITGFGWRSAFFVNLPVGLVAWLVGRRGADVDDGIQHPVVAGLSRRGICSPVRSPRWCSASRRARTGAGRAPVSSPHSARFAVLLALFLRRSAHHTEPVLDLTLFRSRTFAVANLATLLYAMGFFAMLLGNILFLTSVWHYSILVAGLAVTPGPLVVAVVSGPAGKLAGRIGFRPVLLVGFAVFASAPGLVRAAGRDPSRVPDGVAARHAGGRPGHRLTFPVLSAAAVSDLHPQRFAVGSAVKPDGATGRWRTRGGLPGGAPRDAGDARAGARQLPPPVVVRGDHGRVVGTGVRAARAKRSASSRPSEQLPAVPSVRGGAGDLRSGW